MEVKKSLSETSSHIRNKSLFESKAYFYAKYTFFKRDYLYLTVNGYQPFNSGLCIVYWNTILNLFCLVLLCFTYNSRVYSIKQHVATDNMENHNF